MSDTAFKFRYEKGTYRYIKRQRILEIIKTLILFALAAGIYLIGYLTLGSSRSLWTVFSILGVLPAAKSAVSMIMFIKTRSLDEEEFISFSKAAGDVPALYELLFTTSDRSYYVPCLICSQRTICAYSDIPETSLTILSEHIRGILDDNGVKGYSLKIFNKKEAFISRADEMRHNLGGREDHSSDEIFPVLLAIVI